MPRISFRNLQANDLPLLHDWLNRPHMRMHYQAKPISLDDVVAKYEPRLATGWPTKTHIALCDGAPIGKLQCYRVQDYPAFAAEIGVTNGISIDLFIGDETFIGKGIGSQMLKTYIEEIAFATFPEENVIYICHEVSNTAALATSKSIGFKLLRYVVEEGKKSALLYLSKP